MNQQWMVVHIGNDHALRIVALTTSEAPAESLLVLLRRSRLPGHYAVLAPTAMLLPDERAYLDANGSVLP